MKIYPVSSRGRMTSRAAKMSLLIVVIVLALIVFGIAATANAEESTTVEEPTDQILLVSAVLTGQDTMFLDWASQPVEEQMDTLPQPKRFSGFIKTEGRDKYLGANGAVFHPDPGGVIQIDVSWRGWYADVWVLHSGGKWKSTFGHEVDYTIGHAGKVGDYAYDVGVAYFDIVDGGLGFEDALNPYLKVSRPFEWGVPYAKFEHYYPIEGSLPASGQQYHVGMTIGDDCESRWQWSGTIDTFYDTGAFGFDAGVLGSVSATLTYDLGAVSIGPTVRLTAPISSVNDGREEDATYSLAITRSF